VIQAIQKRLRNDEEGFTLIELMVVVLIIAILIAIAIPTFLGARTRAQDRAAQSDLRNALVAAEVLYTDNESYTMADTDLTAVEPELTFDETVGASGTVGTVFVSDSAAEVTFVRQSASGTYWGIRKNEGTGTFYCEGTSEAALDPAQAGACAGTSW
jgi:type IV pilus assembly protein PilA